MSFKARLSMFGLVSCLVAATVLFGAAGGRVKGTIVDENGEPVPGVSITITSERIAFDETLESDQKGRFVVMFVDASERYEFRFEKDGYQPTVVDFKPAVGANLRQEFRMPTQSASDVRGGAVTEQRVDPALEPFNEGVEAVRAGDLDLAESKFEEARKISPNRPEPYTALASLYVDQGRADEAMAMAKKALELHPEAVRPLLVLYDVYTSRGEDEKADEALARLKSMGGTEAALRIYNAGAQAAIEGDVETAMRLLTQATEADPGLAAAHGALASIYLGLGEHSQAIAAADEALAADPQFHKVYRVKYDAHRALGDEEGAQQAFELMSSADPAGTAEVLYQKGKTLFEAGNTGEAMNALERAVSLDAANARAHYMLGLCYLNASRSDEAKTHLEKFLELAPDDPEAANAQAMLDYAG
jgi:tetratricopeptide (TPR) repeat protein